MVSLERPFYRGDFNIITFCKLKMLEKPTLSGFLLKFSFEQKAILTSLSVFLQFYSLEDSKLQLILYIKLTLILLGFIIKQFKAMTNCLPNILTYTGKYFLLNLFL